MVGERLPDAAREAALLDDDCCVADHLDAAPASGHDTTGVPHAIASSTGNPNPS